MDRADRTLLAIALLALLAGFTGGDSFELRLLAQSGLYALLALGFRPLFGGLGVLSLAQAGLFGLGAYAMAAALVDAHLPLPLAVLLAVASPALLALVVGLPLLHLGSHYFALASLGLAQILFLLALNWQSLTGGANGKGGIAAAAFDLPSTPVGVLAIVVWICVLVVAAAMAWRQSGLAGLRADLLREAPFTAAAIGVDGGRARLSAFVLSGAAAGLAGAGQALLAGVVAPDLLELGPMILCLGIVVIGGRSSVFGILLAALLLVHLPEWLRWTGPWYLVANAGVTLLVLALVPDGLAGILRRPLGGPKPPLPAAAPPATGAIAPLTLAVDSLSKNFGGVKALDNVAMEIAGGEIVGLIGANGAGKSTLLNLIGGQVPADAGAARLDGHDIRSLSAPQRARRGIARIFQTVQLPQDMSAIDAVAVAAPAKTLTSARTQALGWMTRLGLSEQAQTPVGQLPPAMRRRLDLARALVQAPRLLLLDEPVGGLSLDERNALAATLQGLRHDGMAILIVEHHVDWLLALCDRLYCLDQGRIVAHGNPDDLRARPELARFFAATLKARP